MKKNGKKPSHKSAIVTKCGYTMERIRLPEPHNNSIWTHRWAVDLEWLAGHNSDNGQELADSGSDTLALEWRVLKAKGKQKAKEVYRAKPTGRTQGNCYIPEFGTLLLIFLSIYGYDF